MERSIGFGQALKLFWKNYVNFKGRSRRSEYWFMALWNIIFMMPALILYIIGLIMTVSGAASSSEELVAIGVILLFLSICYALIYSLATLIPGWALLIRRFHDTGRTMLMPLIYLGVIIISYPVLFVVNIQDPEYNNPVYIIFFAIIFLVYIALGIYMLVICCLDSERKTNKYGASHKYGNHIKSSTNTYANQDAPIHEDTNVKHVNSEENAFSEEVNTSDENATKKDDNFKY